MARLSVNLNKTALLRNSRHTGVPDVLTFAGIAIESGAKGITVHPRPDQRHIRKSDVPALSKLLRPFRSKIEFNIEGYPDKRYLGIVTAARPEQCTLVPDSPSAFTSEKGWDLSDGEMRILHPAIKALKKIKTRIILFVDPDFHAFDKLQELGAAGIEIYTGAYAASFRSGTYAKELKRISATAHQAHAQGFTVNIGHDLNLNNLPPLLVEVPFVAEASIGHELTADALAMGFASSVRAYAHTLAAHEFTDTTLHETTVDKNPFKQFDRWFISANNLPKPNAMILATASKKGEPSARVILLKQYDRRGFVFYTNYGSRKSRELLENPHAALVFHWPELERQVRITGKVAKISHARSLKYFRSRSRGSQIGAWASIQSTEISSRSELDDRVEELRKRYEGKDIPLPPHWGGYSLKPDEFEFWYQGKSGRLHDRIVYRQQKNGSWKIGRLAA